MYCFYTEDHGNQKRALDFLELEIKGPMSSRGGARN